MICIHLAADLESLIGDASLGDDELNAFLLGDNEETRATSEETAAALDGAPSRLRLYSDQAFLVEGYRYLSEDNPDYPALEESGGLVTLTAPKDLERRLGAPDARGDVVFGATAIALEAWPENSQFRLTADPRRVEQAIERARHLAGYWSKELLCSEQHPILQWIAERLVMRMGRGKAPLINSRHLEPGELCFCFVGQVCSNAGTPLIVDAHAILFRKGGRLEERPLIEALEAARFDQLVNTGGPPRTEAAEALVSAAVDASLEQMERSIKDRQESWRDVHLDAAHEPSTRLILVIEGVDA